MDRKRSCNEKMGRREKEEQKQEKRRETWNKKSLLHHLSATCIYILTEKYTLLSDHLKRLDRKEREGEVFDGSLTLRLVVHAIH